MTEGGTQAPIRRAIDWRNPDFYDRDLLDREMRRVFDICHGCRRCFNLCDSFPRLFDLIDESASDELDSVDSLGFARVVEACTLCDMCFMTKCPYVPPHEFDLDFPHLMLRAMAVEHKEGRVGMADRALARTDLNGRLAGAVAPVANWASAEGNRLTRPLIEGIAGIHRGAALPRYESPSFVRRARRAPAEVDAGAPAHGRKAVLYGTCFVNYNNPHIGVAAQAVLARNGVETEVVHPRCCGMPLLEQGDIEGVARAAETVAAAFLPWIERGYEVIGLVPSCTLMMKFEWPLIVPDSAPVKRLSEHAWELSEYIVDIAANEGLAPGLVPVAGGIAVHLACHARAQNMGPKAADMMALIPDTEVTVIERCSGHGGAKGMKKHFFEVGLKVGKPVARQALKAEAAQIASECPLAAMHIVQGMGRIAEDGTAARARHPIEILAQAYGLETGDGA